MKNNIKNETLKAEEQLKQTTAKEVMTDEKDEAEIRASKINFVVKASTQTRNG